MVDYIVMLNPFTMYQQKLYSSLFFIKFLQKFADTIRKHFILLLTVVQKLLFLIQKIEIPSFGICTVHFVDEMWNFRKFYIANLKLFSISAPDNM